MPRFASLLFLLALVACGGHKCAGNAPAPESASATAPSSPRSPSKATKTGTVTAERALPPAPELDSIIPPEELAAEIRLAADSAADEAVLEELADATPTGPGEAEIEGDDAKALAGAVTWDIDVATYNSHDRVRWYLDFFQGKGRERMGIWLNRMPRYEPMIRERLQREGLPGDLVYLALIESGFSNTATSRARAVGMWQFMKGTAKLYGMRVDSWVDERRDPYRATDAAARHLRDLNDRFGSLYLAAAAYNAGSGRVSRGLRRLPDDDEADSASADAMFFRLYDTKLLRRETKDYVPKLIAAALIAKEPARYGFAVTASEPPTYDSIVVPTMTGLDVIARLADTTVAAIRELNPQYLRLATPPAWPRWSECPGARRDHGGGVRGAAAQPAGHLRRALRRPGRDHGRHRPALSREQPAAPGREPEGARQSAPGGPTADRADRRRDLQLGGAADVRPAEAGRHQPLGAGIGSAGARRSPPSPTTTVSRSAICSAWNSLDANGAIRAGQRIRVAAPPEESSDRRAAAASAATTASPRTHTVKRGDTLTGLARRYGVSVEALREANGMSERQTLRPGAALRIPG